MTVDDMILRNQDTEPVAASVNCYHEYGRTPSLSVGSYVIAPGPDHDDQVPHNEDEVYVVVAGCALFESDGTRRSVGPGSVILVRRGSDHRFVDISEPLEVIVVFAPPYSGR